MGRQRYPKRKNVWNRGKLKVDKTHESEPEKTGTGLNNETGNLAWDSLDETCFVKTPSLCSGTEYLPSPDEMEVTRKLSCLNFSILSCPCPPSTMLLEPLPDLGDNPDEFGYNCELLPTLSDREMDFMHQGMRYLRKRPSRRKPNKRIKKSRPCHENISSQTNQKHSGDSAHPSLSVSFVRSTVKDPQLTRSQSLRKPRHVRSRKDEDPLLCFLSDTSAVCDVEVPSQEDMFGCTSPGTQFVGAIKEDVTTNNLPNMDSDLTETTTSDSGCEGDDEESSVEGPLLKKNEKLSGWWEKRSLKDSCSEDDKFSQILNSALPLMSDSGREQFADRLYPEFKHPGLFGVNTKRGRKKRGKPQVSTSLTLMEVNQRIVQFVQNGLDNELKFNLVSRALCHTISCLARVYKLDCFIEQKRRLPVATPLLRRSLFTRLASRQEIEPILKNHGRESPSILFRDDVIASSERFDLVGGGIPPLSESNVGNQMLQNMGWKPGMGLGPHGNGVREPVIAEFRPKKSGLGY